jgi:hypothetical protein
VDDLIFIVALMVAFSIIMYTGYWLRSKSYKSANKTFKMEPPGGFPPPPLRAISVVVISYEVYNSLLNLFAHTIIGQKSWLSGAFSEPIDDVDRQALKKWMEELFNIAEGVEK